MYDRTKRNKTDVSVDDQKIFSEMGQNVTNVGILNRIDARSHLSEEFNTGE